MTEQNTIIIPDDYFLPEPLPSALKTFLIVSYSIVIVLAITGNILVFVVILFTKAMRSVTNVFLVSLAISDILIASWNIPMMLLFYIKEEWTIGEIPCKFTSYLQTVNVLASIITLTVVALERYYAICHPLKARRVRTAKRAAFCLIIIWVVAICISLPMLWTQRLGARIAIGPLNGENGSLRLAFVCEEYYEKREYNVLHSYFLVVVCYIFPMLMMFCAYGMICYTVWVRKPIGEAKSSVNEITRSNIQKKRIIRMLITLVVVFSVCWMPFFSLMLYQLYHDVDFNYRITASIFQLIGFSNSFCNPIVYGFMNENFKFHMKEMFFKCRKRTVEVVLTPQVQSMTVESIM